jgi:hypothetical protein
MGTFELLKSNILDFVKSQRLINNPITLRSNIFSYDTMELDGLYNLDSTFKSTQLSDCLRKVSVTVNTARFWTRQRC